MLFMARGASASIASSNPVGVATAQNLPGMVVQPEKSASGFTRSRPEDTISSQGPALTGSSPIAEGEELTLDEAIRIALLYHPRQKEAESDTSAAHERVGEAQSYLGPQLFGVGQYLRSTDNGIGNTSYYNVEDSIPRMTGTNHDLPSDDFSQSWNTSNNYAGGIALSQFLFVFGSRRGLVDERRFEAASAVASQQLVELDLIFEVSQRYYNVLQARQLIRVYEKAVEQRQYHLHEAQVKAGAGLRPQLDVYVMRAEVERAQLYLVDARNGYADARAALDNAMGLSDRAPSYHLADVLAYSQIKDTVNAFIKTAMQQRPDLKAMQDQASAMGARIAEYNSDYYPTVNAVAGYSALGTGLPAANNFNAGIVITWPLFNSFLTTDQIAETKFRRRSMEAAIADLRQQIILQVQTAFLNWQASLQRIEFSQKALAASQVELALAEKRYQTGLADILELEDAQRHYTDDEAAYANALYSFSVTKAAVDQATALSLSSL
ncbi:MAG: TolC family protein [Candidatus Binataceae bacterium]